MDMEPYEIDLWDFFNMLNEKKLFIIGFVCISMVVTSIISYFFLEKQYRSEIWIKLSDKFLYNQNETPYDYLKIYFIDPKVTQLTFNDDSILLGFKDRFSIKKVDGMLKIELTHPRRSNISETLLQWMNTTRVKLINNEGPRVVSTIENQILANQMIMQNMQENLGNISNVLKKEKEYVLIEVFPKDVVNPQTVVYKEINPSYIELKAKAMQIDLKMKTLKNQNTLLQNILENYKLLLSKISEIFELYNTAESKIFEQLKQTQTKYLTYLKEMRSAGFKEDYELALYNSLIPFEIITQPYTTTNPVSPNVKLNVAIAGVLSLFISVFFVFILNYLEAVKKEKIKR